MEIQKFSPNILKQVKDAPRAKIIGCLLKEYYDETLDQAQRNPSFFGEEATAAEDDPRSLARVHTEKYRDVLNKRERKALEFLYANYILDHEEIEKESKLQQT